MCRPNLLAAGQAKERKRGVAIFATNLSLVPALKDDVQISTRAATQKRHTSSVHGAQCPTTVLPMPGVCGLAVRPRLRPGTESSVLDWLLKAPSRK